MSAGTITLPRLLQAFVVISSGLLGGCGPRQVTTGEQRADPASSQGKSGGIEVAVPGSAVLANGLSLRLVKADNVPLVTITLVVPCGSASDPEGKEGLASLTASMLDEGAGTRSALDLAEEIEFLGASLSIDTKRDYATISMQTLARNLQEALDLFADVVVRPSFDEEEWARVKRLRLNSLRQRSENAVSVARLVGDRLFYGEGHPYSHPPAGFVDSVEKIELDDVRAFWMSVARPSRSMLLVTGDFEIGELKMLVDARLGAWKPDHELIGSPVITGTRTPARSRARLIIVDKPDSPQTVIRVYQVAPAFGAPQVPPLLLVNTVLGGTFTSRLNSNLREDKKITYGARSYLNAPLSDFGYIVAATSVQTDATAMGLAELHREFRGIATGKLREGELSKARASRQSRLVESMERQSSLLSIYETSAAARKPPAERRDFYRRLLRVTREEVEATCRAVFDWDRALIVLVGDLSKIVLAIETLQSAEGAERLGLTGGLSLPEPELKDREGR